jgi:hypothetical protein
MTMMGNSLKMDENLFLGEGTSLSLPKVQIEIAL